MTAPGVTCLLCGHSFDPAGSVACGACPLSPGCRVTCCPACGYSWVDPQQTTLGRWMAERIEGRRRRNRRREQGDSPGALRTLAEVPPRTRARILSCAGLPDDRRRRLRAYGLTDGGVVEVLQQIPATLITLDQAEIAVEADLARCILVEIEDRPDPVPARHSGRGRRS